MNSYCINLHLLLVQQSSLMKTVSSVFFFSLFKDTFKVLASDQLTLRTDTVHSILQTQQVLLTQLSWS